MQNGLHNVITSWRKVRRQNASWMGYMYPSQLLATASILAIMHPW